MNLFQDVHLDSILECVCAQFESVVALERVSVARVRAVTANLTKVGREFLLTTTGHQSCRNPGTLDPTNPGRNHI